MRFFKKNDGVQGRQEHYGAVDLLRDILTCIGVTVLSGAWTMLCLMIMSFIFLNYIPFHVKWMIPAAIIAGILAGTAWTVSTVRKRRRS